MNPLRIITGIALLSLGALTVYLWMENEALRTRLSSREAASVAEVERGQPAASPKQKAGNGAVSSQTNNAASPPSFTANASDEQLVIRRDPDGTLVLHSIQNGVASPMTLESQKQLMQKLAASQLEKTSRFPNGPSWSPGQAAGAPNTKEAGDFTTAWASQIADGGVEWLQLKYPNSVEISEINIHETYNPGALSKVTALLPDGREQIIWEGVEPVEPGAVERSIPVPPGIRSDQIKVYLDTGRVPGWNEIDAVELVGRNGTRQWATESTASSYFGQGHSNYFQPVNSFSLDIDVKGPR